MCLIYSGTSELLTYIQWCWPHRVMFWGICLRVSGGSTRKEFTLMGPKVPGMLDPPSGAQVSFCDQSLKRFVRWDSPISQSVSHSVRASGGGGYCRSCEIRASFHMCINIDPTRRWRFVMSWSELIRGWKRLFFLDCTCIYVYISALYVYDTCQHRNMSGKRYVYRYIFSFHDKNKTLSFHTLQSKAKRCSPGGTLNMCPGRFMAV